MKTPEEIKKGILCDGPCNECPYRGRMMSDGGCGQAVTDDTIDYIQQLESRLAQAERERDAAVEDFTQFVNYGEHECKLCRHYEEVCLNCTWEWRGVKINDE